MAEFVVTDPEGKEFVVNAPDGATQDQALQFAQSQFGAQPSEAASTTEAKPINTRARSLQSLSRSLAFGPDFKAATTNLGSLGDLDKGAIAAGGDVTDLTGSPLLGTAVRMLPDVASMIGGPTASASKFAPAIGGYAKELMQRAIKPLTKDLLSGKADRAAETMLEKGLNVSKTGTAALREEGTALNDQVISLLQQSGKSIDKNAVASRIQDVVSKVEKFESTPQDSIAAVERVYDQFLSNGLIQKSIPVERAQELKQGIYAMLKKKYGQLGTDTEEAQKALGRGYKEELEKAVPQVASLNAEASKVWNALNVVERRALLELNKDVGGLALLTHNPKLFMAYMADKSSLFKSVMSNWLNKNQRAIAATPGAAAGAAYPATNQ